ncbi:MAG TPA: carotenoid biosynthesis protein [Actinomycetales bacterium]|nr:carotenoid biosynthesis protein [Actinomycetales bacterium]
MLRQPAGPASGLRAGATLVVVLAGLTILAQVAYPLTQGEPLRVLTIATVVLFAVTVVVHAWLTRGPAWATVLTVATLAAALVVEGVGLRTGRPFGHYAYRGTLGPTLGDVPVVVPLAWLMMVYPCLLLARLLAARLAVASERRRRGRRPRRRGRAALVPVALIGGWAMAAWDVFIDPQMVAAGHWTWQHAQPGLPGTTGVPLTNAVGWLLSGSCVIGLLHLVLPGRPRPRVGPRTGVRADVVPAALLAWTWLGSTLANAAFFGRPAVAAWGGVLLGVVVLPYLLVLWGRRP